MQARALSPDRSVGKYRIIGQLGEGGQARIYLALMTGPGSFNKLLVLKVLRESDDDDPLFVQAFMQEARLAAQVNHPGIVQTYEVGVDRGSHYIAMEYVAGQSLRAIQRRIGEKLPLRVHLGLLADVARALHHTHTLRDFDGTPLNLVHRDVSPQNVMVSYEGSVKLLDFGIAKISGNNEFTQEGMIKGKIAYMAPEQIKGGGIDHRADVFSLGVMVWQAVTGKKFAGGQEVSELTQMQYRLDGREPRLRDASPTAHKALIDLCDRALSVDPTQRQASAEQFADEMSDYLTESSGNSYPRELARIVSAAFAEERRAAEKMIDEQVRLASEMGDQMDIVPMYEISIDDSSETEAEVVDPASTKKSAQARRGIIGAIGIGGGVLALVLTAVVFTWDPFGTRSHGEAAPITNSSPRAPVEVSEPPRPVQNAVHQNPLPANDNDIVRVRVRVRPANARVELDGMELPNPVDVNRPRDSRRHVLSVTALGYLPERQEITLDDDVEIGLSMRRMRGRPGRPFEEAEVARPSEEVQVSQPRQVEPRRSDPPENEEERPRVLRPRVDIEDPYQ